MLKKDQVNYVQLGINGSALELHGQWLDDFDEDAIRVVGPAYISGCTIIDRRASNDAHCDAIQLIPTGDLKMVETGFVPAIPRAQYAAGLLGSVYIADNHIRSRGKLQGIFCSDGLLADISVINNVIETKGQHFITLGGLINGRIEGNKTTDGVPCPITLTPLRIGGSTSGGNVYVIGFAVGDVAYAELAEIVPCETERASVKDLRQIVFNDRDTFLSHFDLTAFYEAVACLAPIRDVVEHCAALKQLALRFGQVVPFPDVCV